MGRDNLSKGIYPLSEVKMKSMATGKTVSVVGLSANGGIYCVDELGIIYPRGVKMKSMKAVEFLSHSTIFQLVRLTQLDPDLELTMKDSVYNQIVREMKAKVKE